MWTRRDDVLIFHACVPVDEHGTPLELEVDGVKRSGRDLMDELATVVRRAFRKGAEGRDSDADWLWYMWGSPRSPLFGKDKLATFEGHFVADKAAKEEKKNAYFDLIHDAEFTRRIGRLFGMGDDVLIVNGHVPVKVEKGEKPVKRGGNAVTIDGAFSEAYGDRGYTLVLAPDRIDLAEHSKFESVEQVVSSGADIVPKMTTIREYPSPRTIGDTHRGASIRRGISDLDMLVKAYEEGVVEEK
jgi:fructose-1,6-bisphosphatase-3